MTLEDRRAQLDEQRRKLEAQLLRLQGALAILDEIIKEQDHAELHNDTHATE